MPALPTPAPALTPIQHSVCCDACLADTCTWALTAIQHSVRCDACLADTCTGIDSNSTLSALRRLP